MATINDGEINLCIEGADEAGLRRGLAAARASIQASGFAIEQVFSAWFDRDGADIAGGFDQLDDWTAAAAEVMDNAIQAAATACFPGAADPARIHAELSIQAAFERAEQQLDELGVRHLNQDRGPHYVMER